MVQKWYESPIIIIMPSTWRGGGEKNFACSRVAKKFDVFCMFLSVAVLNGKVCERHVAIKPFELRNSFDTVEYGKVCSRADAFNFVSTPLRGATRGC